MSENKTPTESEDQIPPEVRAKLLQMYGLAPDIPESVSDSIRADAHRHLNSMPTPARDSPGAVRFRNRVRWMTLTVGSLAATALVLVLLVRQPPREQQGAEELALRELTDDAMPSAQPLSASADVLLTDLNDDGVVDILDAFTLASRLESGETLDRGDVNRDGRQDQEDVQWIASRVVLLHDPF